MPVLIGRLPAARSGGMRMTFTSISLSSHGRRRKPMPSLWSAKVGASPTGSSTSGRIGWRESSSALGSSICLDSSLRRSKMSKSIGTVTSTARVVTTQKVDFDDFVPGRQFGPWWEPALSFSRDGGRLAFVTDESGQYNLWLQPSTGGPPSQLTHHVDRSVKSAVWSPDGRFIAYIADHHADEYYQVFLLSMRDGSERQITTNPKALHHLTHASWSPDGRSLAYFANDRNPEAMDIVVYDLVSNQHRRLLAGDSSYSLGGWSPDGQSLVVLEEHPRATFDLHLVKLGDCTWSPLVDPTPDVQYVPGPWTLDGSGFYVLTDGGRQFMGLAFFDVDERRLRWIERPDWDVERVGLSPDGSTLAWVVNEDGASRVYVRMRSGRTRRLDELSDGVIEALALSRDGRHLAALAVSPTHQHEIVVANLRERTLVRCRSEADGKHQDAPVRPETVRFRAPDGRSIPGLLYRPRAAAADRPSPVVVAIHPGPKGQERPVYAYCGMYQYLVSRGIGILAPNIRGSSGYGKAYQRLVYRDWGGADLGDIDAAALFLKSLDWVDPERLGVFGYSYGAFLTLATLGRSPQHWAAGASWMGASNLVTFIRDIPPQRRRFRDAAIGHPDRDHDFLMSRSPITHASGIRAPLLVVQGGLDRLVLRAQTEEMVAYLRSRGVPIEYELFEDEGHGFERRPNAVKICRDTSRFFETRLLRASTAHR